jgi:CBS domain containing-hemolysin-like protein
LLLITLSGFVAAAENAANQLSRTSLAEQRANARSATQRLIELRENPFRFWVSARVGTALIVFTAAALTATTVSDALSAAIASRAGGVVIAMGLLAVLFSVFGVVVPRILAQRHPEPMAQRLSILCWTLYKSFLPLTRHLEGLLSLAEQQAWKGPAPEDEAVIDAVEEGTREGAIDEHDFAMISNVIELGDHVARQVMTPRPDVIAVSVDSPVHDAMRTANQHGMSRLPVYGKNLDDVVGIVHVRDAIATLLDSNGPASLSDLLRAPYFVPESKRVDELLRELLARKTHMSIVVNEYGETAGLVTIEDLLEEIVGEIEDEFDESESQIQVISPNEIVVDAGVLIADVNQALGLALHDQDVDTIGGLVYNEMGRIPRPGEDITVDSAAIQVMETRENRIVRVRVSKQPDLDTDGGG